MATNETGKLARDRTALLAEIATETKDPRVIDALSRVPRERFVPEDLREFAYENRPLPIAYGQTISQPLIVAMMTDALMLKGDERVLGIGTGSGYQAAVLSLIAAHVVSVERIAPLAEEASATLREPVRERGGSRGGKSWAPEGAPYDGIIVTAASPDVPLSLLRQLATGGRLVIPVGSRELQELVRIEKTPMGAKRQNLGPCRFVPLLGPGAWPAESAS